MANRGIFSQTKNNKVYFQKHIKGTSKGHNSEKGKVILDQRKNGEQKKQ